MAQHVSIIRDDWGIAHVHGRTDAQAVFAMIYAQAEDDFNRVETNYLTALGWTAQAEGEGAIWSDLRARLYVDDEDLKVRYRHSPVWLRKLMSAWADGLNFYLEKHPQVTPRVIRHFEPWMPLSFSEGSIGGDIERIDLAQLAAFYGNARADITAASRERPPFTEPGGSNGIAIAPSNTLGHHALLLINPHTSFYFRAEMQVTSDEGLDVYGAATWGQFFIYQGFNAHTGWMHTSSAADVVDEFVETVVKRDHRLFYKYSATERPIVVQTIKVPYRSATGAIDTRTFTVYRTHHGPVVRELGGKWISIALMYKPIEALSQSFLRTKTRDYASYLKVAALQANSSNNTVFADDSGEIAYLHPQFIPKRDDRFDFTKPVDGADPATDWKGIHALEEVPHLLNPANGWIFNTNDWPYSAAGPYSPKRENFPRYMDTAGENPRGMHAIRVLQGRTDFTLEALRTAAFDSYLPAFARLIPTLVLAYDQLSASDPQKVKLSGQIELLRHWDYRWGSDSQATSLAVFWGEALYVASGYDPNGEAQVIYDYKPVYEFLADHASASQELNALQSASDRLLEDFGDWHVAWGKINRFQRINDELQQSFSDAALSIPVPFTSAEWGSLAAYGSHRYPNTKCYYGDFGNSFVAVVEFGARVHALAVTAGGESGDPTSAHFNDQATRYASGDLREIYFYPDQLERHVQRRYHPGGSSER